MLFFSFVVGLGMATLKFGLRVSEKIEDHGGVLKLLVLSVPDSSPLDEVEQESDLPAKRRKTDSKQRPTTRTPLVTFQGHGNAVTTVVWVGSGQGKGEGLGDVIVSGGWDNCVKVWDTTTGANTTTLVSVRTKCLI